jgi:uncharacterized cupin superfamily protein
MAAVINRDDVAAREGGAGDIRFERRRLGPAAGTARIGCSVYEVPPLARQMPVHVHGDEEEIFYVLGGSGLSWQRDQACEVGPGDVVVHVADRHTHTFLAGEQGLELLALASGSDTSITYLPRAGVMWCGPRWVPVDSKHPFLAEAEAGPLERPEPGERPDNVVALRQVEPITRPQAEFRALGRAGGSVKAGLNHAVLAPGASGAPRHVHALEEELFYVLEGNGTLTLGDEQHPLRAGDVVARPPGTAVPHALRASDQGMTYLAYGTRVAGDSVYYPDTGQVRLRGLGVTLDATTT